MIVQKWQAIGVAGSREWSLKDVTCRDDRDQRSAIRVKS